MNRKDYSVKDEVPYYYDIQGQLAIGTIGSDGTTAEFSGDLTVYKWDESYPDHRQRPERGPNHYPLGQRPRSPERRHRNVWRCDH